MLHCPLLFSVSFQAGFPTPEEEGFENDWLNSFLDDPVLNDKMMTDAMQPPCIKSEHSYSINDNDPGSPLELNNQEGRLSMLLSVCACSPGSIRRAKSEGVEKVGGG